MWMLITYILTSFIENVLAKQPYRQVLKTDAEPNASRCSTKISLENRAEKYTLSWGKNRFSNDVIETGAKAFFVSILIIRRVQEMAWRHFCLAINRTTNFVVLVGVRNHPMISIRLACELQSLTLEKHFKV